MCIGNFLIPSKITNDLCIVVIKTVLTCKQEGAWAKSVFGDLVSNQINCPTVGPKRQKQFEGYKSDVR